MPADSLKVHRLPFYTKLGPNVRRLLAFIDTVRHPNSEPSTSSKRKCEIPGDIVDYILSYLQDDRETLASCSLVSRTWTYFSHRHLFYTVTFQPKPKPNHLNADDLLYFLKGSRDLSTFLTDLRLCGTSYMSLISICAHTLAGILQCLPNIRDLSIQHAEVTRDNRKHEPEVGAPSTLATLHTQRGPFRLRSLDLQASFPTIFELYSLLDIFDHIDKLMFRGGNWAPQNRSGEYLLDRALPDYFPRPVVHNLVVTDGAISNAVLAMMRQSPSVATLHSIEGSIFIWSKGRILQLLEACTNLKVLDMELFVTADTRYLGSVQTVDFSCCLGITSMTVKLTGLPSPVERMELLSVRSTVSSLMSILSTITPSLRTLSIETSLGHLRDETQRLWFFGQLQSALKRFTALESFVLVVFSSLKPAIYDSQIIHVRVELDGPKPISVGGDEAVAIILQEMSDLYLGVPVRVVGRDC